MRTVDEAWTDAPVDACFQAASDVERWPEILPHYRWVRFRSKNGSGPDVVEMAAWRNFPVWSWPTWWVSEMEVDEEGRRVLYRHVDGITRGMDVVWEVRPDGDGRTHLSIVHEWDGPRWPLIRGIAANLVIGPVFISHIAGRTLAGVVRAAEAASKGTA
jgi:ribosome-associated toxin RatA of RatAB toxin-antitoxin module